MSGKFVWVDTQFSKNLRALLDERGEVQGEIATVCGVCRQTVNCWVSGRYVPDTKRLVALAKYFGVSTDYLLGLTSDRKPDTDFRGAREFLGLTDAAIERILALATQEGYVDILSDLLASKSLEPLLYAARKYKLHADEYLAADELDDDYNKVVNNCEIELKQGTMGRYTVTDRSTLCRVAQEEMQDAANDILHEIAPIDEVKAAYNARRLIPGGKTVG